MRTEIELLRAIANEAKEVWDKGQLPLEAIHLMNLLTDRIDLNIRKVSTEYKAIRIAASDELIP